MGCTCTSSVICGDEHGQKETHYGEMYDRLQLLGQAIERVDDIVGDDFPVLTRRAQKKPVPSTGVFHTSSQNSNSVERLTPLHSLLSELQSIAVEYRAFKLAFDNKQKHGQDVILRNQVGDFRKDFYGSPRDSPELTKNRRQKDVYRKRTYHEGHVDQIEVLERTAKTTQFVAASHERKDITAEEYFRDGSFCESSRPSDLHQIHAIADQETTDVALGNDETSIALKVFSLCLTEDAPVYGQRSGLPALLQLQLVGQTEVVGNFNLAAQPDTTVEINSTTVLAISPNMQAAILSAFKRGSYCDMVFSVCLENSSDGRGLPIVLAKAGFRFLRVLDVNLEPERVDLTLRHDRLPQIKVGTITVGIRALDCLKKLCFPELQAYNINNIRGPLTDVTMKTDSPGLFGSSRAD